MLPCALFPAAGGQRSPTCLPPPTPAVAARWSQAVTPRVQASAAARIRQAGLRAARLYDREGKLQEEEERIFPFELEMVEGALMVATGAAGWRCL